jgi:hypothetical protein
MAARMPGDGCVTVSLRRSIRGGGLEDNAVLLAVESRGIVYYAAWRVHAPNPGLGLMQQKQSVIRLNKADTHAAVLSLVAAFNAAVAE